MRRHEAAINHGVLSQPSALALNETALVRAFRTALGQRRRSWRHSPLVGLLSKSRLVLVPTPRAAQCQRTHDTARRSGRTSPATCRTGRLSSAPRCERRGWRGAAGVTRGARASTARHGQKSATVRVITARHDVEQRRDKPAQHWVKIQSRSLRRPTSTVRTYPYLDSE
jgi:hypothetical protein